jgi:hypothetical protein
MRSIFELWLGETLADVNAGSTQRLAELIGSIRLVLQGSGSLLRAERPSSRCRQLKRLAERGAEAAGDDLVRRRTAWEQVVVSTAGIAPPGTHAPATSTSCATAGRVIVDARPLIAYFDAADALHERAVASGQRLGGQRLAISSLTLAEALVLVGSQSPIPSTGAAADAMMVTDARPHRSS